MRSKSTAFLAVAIIFTIAFLGLLYDQLEDISGPVGYVHL